MCFSQIEVLFSIKCSKYNTVLFEASNVESLISHIITLYVFGSNHWWYSGLPGCFLGKVHVSLTPLYLQVL